jgi:hypothetical protein
MKKIILKIFTFVLLISIMNSCSWFGGRSSSENEKLPVLIIKENTVLHNGFETNMTSLSTDLNHKFFFKVKANETVTITKITYKVKIPNYKEIFQGTFYEFQQITIDKDFDLQDINGLTERFSSDKFCEQIQAINESDDGLTNMRIDLKFYTKEKGEILIKDVILDIRKDSLWVKIFNFLQGKTCDVRMIIKKFFGF